MLTNILFAEEARDITRSPVLKVHSGWEGKPPVATISFAGAVQATLIPTSQSASHIRLIENEVAFCIRGSHFSGGGGVPAGSGVEEGKGIFWGGVGAGCGGGP